MSRRLERPSLVAPSLVVGALAIGVRLSAICAAAARSGIDDLDLFPVFADNEMTDEDSAIVAGVGALQAGVVHLYGVVVILGAWVRVVRYSHGVNLLGRLAGSRGVGGLCGTIFMS